MKPLPCKILVCVAVLLLFAGAALVIWRPLHCTTDPVCCTRVVTETQNQPIKCFSENSTNCGSIIPLISGGICQVLLVAGMILFAFYLTCLWFKTATKLRELHEKEEERKQSQEHLKAELKIRTGYEQERDKVNDLFRLMELAKETEESSESAPGTDKLLNRVITKNTVLSMDKLDKLVEDYNSLNIKRKTD